MNEQTSADVPEGFIEQKYEGFVEQFDGDVAHVTLETTEGEILWAECTTAELMAVGIQEKRRFKCRVISRTEFQAIPDKKLTPERKQEIEETLSRLPDTDLVSEGEGNQS